MAGAALARNRRNGTSSVTRTIWLASYPKSGNTWLRVLLANLFVKDGQPININKLPGIGMASARNDFDCIVLIDSGLLTHDEIDCLRPRVYAALARDRFDGASTGSDAPPVRFVKVHDAYTMNPTGEPLLGGSQGADGAIVIVRDPRDVAPSLANHWNISIEKAVAAMNDGNSAWLKKTDRLYAQLRQKLGSWSEHVASWLDQKDIPVQLVRYEDLRKDAAAPLRSALTFAGLPVIEEEIAQAVRFSDFEQLQQQEHEGGFVEASRKGTKFFRRGEVGSWRDELTPEQVAGIESRHGKMMQRLGYEPSHSNLARTG